MAASDTDRPAERDAPASVASARELLGVGAALLVLTALMIAAAELEIGAPWRGLAIVLALSAQAVLVGLSFMGLRRDYAFHGLMVIVALLVVVAFIALTSMDAGQSLPSVIWRQAVPETIAP